MPVASETSRIQYVGNGSTVTPYSVPFYFLANADIRVVVADASGAETLLVESTHYTLTGAGSALGGGLKTTVPYGDTHSLTIYREPQQTQSADFQSTGALPADTLTRGLDKLTMLVQSLSRKLGRCFRLNDKAADVEALSEATRANTVFGFDSNGAPALQDRLALRLLVSLPGSVHSAPTAYWLDDDERALKAPDFVGQLGVQLSSSAVYRSSGTGAGSWSAVTLAGQLALNNIPDAFITYAKLQGMSNGQRILGRKSPGAGPVEELSASDLLSVLGRSVSKVLFQFRPSQNEPPASSFATLDTRNARPVLDFDDTSAEAAVFSGRIPEGVSLANGITVSVQWAATSAITGTVGWDVAFERVVEGSLDMDGDAFDSPRTITASTVPGTSGVTKTTSVAFSQAQLPTGLTTGEAFRVRIRRDVANDNAVGDAELCHLEVQLQ